MSAFLFEVSRANIDVVCRETEPNWDKELAEDVKGECQSKYGKVQYIKVERDSEVCFS